jgi:2-polyprenyl-3-methyl-5-hydroxy-6-metoxy-1,4-benzoquinol methylase
MGQRVLSLLLGCTSRTAEYRFVLKNLPPVGSTILDIGCCDSLLALKLAEKGYQVYGIDTRRYSEKHSNFTFVQEDILGTTFPNGFFDAVIAVSTVEHIGLGAYGDPIHDNADILAVREIHRILKPDGRLIVTTPFAGEYRLAKFMGGGMRGTMIPKLSKDYLKGFISKLKSSSWVGGDSTGLAHLRRRPAALI